MCLWIILVLLPIWQILVNYISIDFELSAEGIIEELRKPILINIWLHWIGRLENKSIKRLANGIEKE